MGPTQRPLPDNIQFSQETAIHIHGGIRTRNPSKWAAAKLHHKPRDQRVRPNYAFLAP